MKNANNTVPYFGDREEQAVIDYITTDSKEIKDMIYNQILLEPFRKMLQSILRRYPIHIGNYDIDEVESNALSHLIEHMVKYNPNKITKSGNKTKAYSYCQTIIRNYYKDHSKRTNIESKINLSYDDYAEEINENINFSYVIGTESSNHMENLIGCFINKIESKIQTDSTLKKNEIIVGEAIVNIMKNWNVLFIEDTPDGKYDKRVTNKYQKSKILLFLKEQTFLTTKEIRLALKPFKDIYFLEKKEYFDE